jgi:hypothetical protein
MKRFLLSDYVELNRNSIGSPGKKAITKCIDIITDSFSCSFTRLMNSAEKLNEWSKLISILNHENDNNRSPILSNLCREIYSRVTENPEDPHAFYDDEFTIQLYTKYKKYFTVRTTNRSGQPYSVDLYHVILTHKLLKDYEDHKTV